MKKRLDVALIMAACSLACEPKTTSGAEPEPTVGRQTPAASATSESLPGALEDDGGAAPDNDERVSRLDEALELQGTDSQWSPQAEGLARSKLPETFTGTTLRLESVRCAKTFCRYVIAWATNVDEFSIKGKVVEAGLCVGACSLSFFVGRDNKTVVYLSKPGLDLPGPDGVVREKPASN
jgi:hypothetical protein